PAVSPFSDIISLHFIASPTSLMPEEFKNKLYLTPNEVAQWMMVSPITVRSWAQKGLLRAEVTPGGHRRFHRQEVERFARLSHSSGNASELKILIVDDDKAVVGFLSELLDGDYPTIIDSASDGFEAGHKVHAFAPHIILLDLMMPGLKGSDVCRQIKQIPGQEHVRIIGMSGFLSAENEAEFLDAGAECCFTKPIDTERLFQVIGIDYFSVSQS
ncbi:MAG: response regulator, partial [Burkholderiales bacterium]|nr:response regulator [Burkholderiales bacterium]